MHSFSLLSIHGNKWTAIMQNCVFLYFLMSLSDYLCICTTGKIQIEFSFKVTLLFSILIF